MYKIIIILVTVFLYVVIPLLINKSTEARFDWVKPHLRPAWTIIFIVAALLFCFTDHQLMEVIVKSQKTLLGGLKGYVICFFFGGLMLCGVWYITGKIFSDTEINKPPAAIPTQMPESSQNEQVHKQPHEKPPTAEEIAKALKKEIAPQLKGNETTKHPPDITKAKKQTLITSMSQFPSGSPLKDVSGIVKGYFELSGGPAPGSPYSNPTVTTKDNFSPHLYTSVRLAALENAQTMDFMGRDVWVCVLPDWTAFMIWETEQSQTVWKPIQVEKHPILNTLAIYQKGRNVSIFINNNYVDSFIKLRSPQPGPISISLKANSTKGGKMFFRDFSIWDFEKP